jgi:hypothetical protein
MELLKGRFDCHIVAEQYKPLLRIADSTALYAAPLVQLFGVLLSRTSQRMKSKSREGVPTMSSDCISHGRSSPLSPLLLGGIQLLLLLIGLFLSVVLVLARHDEIIAQKSRNKRQAAIYQSPVTTVEQRPVVWTWRWYA